MEVRIAVDNTDKVLEELEQQCRAALEACGNQAVTHAKSNITSAGRVDTGALRNSISHQVQDDTCYVGTNQEYAIYNEYGTGIYVENGTGRQSPWAFQDKNGEWHMTHGMRPIHFLKNAISEHVDEYKKIIEQQLKG